MYMMGVYTGASTGVPPAPIPDAGRLVCFIDNMLFIGF